MNHNKIILQNLGDACGGSWDSIYDAALVATTVLKNVKDENTLLREALTELGGPKYFEEWCRMRDTSESTEAR